MIMRKINKFKLLNKFAYKIVRIVRVNIFKQILQNQNILIKEYHNY